ncbi:MAG: ABC transporter permease subunit [Kiloniellales bacterium]|nr:ABC transporter permease subunit [Kiloniellales bacterium]
MKALLILAAKELRDGLRNRWVAAAILLLATLALSLATLGSAPVGTVKAGALSVTIASLSSLTVYLLPLIALLLAYDALVGEAERGTLLLLLAYPVARWQVVLGKFLGHLAILAVAILVGYGAVLLGLALTGKGTAAAGEWQAFGAMMASSLLLGAAFLALGYLPSALVRERATAAGAAIGLWLIFVVLYDLTLLGLLIADEGQRIGQALISTLLVVNPTDAYRLFNLAGSDGVGQVSGMAGLASAGGFAPATLLLAILAWVALPLAATVLVFRKKEI